MASNNVKFDVIDDNPEDKQNFDKTVIDPQSTALSENATSIHVSAYAGFTWQQPHRSQGGGKQDPNDQPPLRPPFQSNEEELDPKDLRFARIIAGATRHSVKPDMQSPNYRGIEKPKINFFDGDASKYSHWKSTFHLMYTADRNLPESHLATTLFGLLKGEAKRAVEIHITAEWNGTNYQEMWKQLDLRYGTKHVQARCIRDKANQIPYLDTLTLKSTLAFYEGVTVQVNHHMVQQPHAVQDNNSHLFQFLKEKMSNKLIDKYIEYLDSDTHETPLARTVLTLQYWLERQISRLQEVEITSNTSKIRSSKSPRRQITTGYVDNNEVDYFDVEDVSEYDKKPLACSTETSGTDVKCSTNTDSASTDVKCSPNTDSVSLQTRVYKITGSQGRKGSRIIALLDPGSTQIYVDREAAVRLRLKRTSKTFTLKVTYCDKQVNLDTYTVEFFLKSCDGTLTQTVTAYTVQNMTKNISAVDWSQEKYKFSDLLSVPFEPFSEVNSISLLIGSDYLSLLRNLDTGSGTSAEPIAQLTPLGWICLNSPNVI